MNSKWYTSTFFVILFILFGAFQEKSAVPNQEIVLEFVDTTTHQEEIKNTISNLKEKLLELGVTNIVIQETTSGKLKISYFSSLDIQKIKDGIADKNLLTLNKKQKENSESIYLIQVQEIINTVNVTNLEDKFIFEIKYGSDRFTTNNSFAHLRNTSHHKAKQLFKTAYNLYKKDVFCKDHSSYKEPEVRAGPKHYKA
jgi:hypothetical protein